MRRLRSARTIGKLLPLMGLALLVAIMSQVDFDRAWQVLLSANTWLLLLSLYLVLVEAAVKTLKLQLLIGSHCSCSFAAALRVYLSGILFGAISPGKVGDFVKTFSLSKETRLARLPSFAIVLVERILELACLMALTLLALWTLVGTGSADVGVVEAGLIAVGFIAAFGLLLSQRITIIILLPLHRILLARQGEESFLAKFDMFYDAVSLTYRRANILLPAVLLGLVGWVVVSLRSYVIASALGLQVDFGAFFLLWPLVIAVEILPISMLGLGTREYAIVHLLGRFGVPLESSVVLSLLGFVVVIVPLVLGGYVSILLQSRGDSKPAAGKAPTS